MRKLPHLPIDEALKDHHLLGAALGPAQSWETWLAVLRAAFGLDLDNDQQRAFRSVSGDRKPPRAACQGTMGDRRPEERQDLA